MYDKLAYALVPSGYKANKLYSFVGGDMTFTRTSTATRINKDGYVEFVETGVPRLNYPLVNGVPSSTPELLLEPARINYALYSEDFSDATWTKLNSTISADSFVAPDGNTTADAMYETTTSGEHLVRDGYSFTSGTTYTASVFTKYLGRTFSMYSTGAFACNVNFNFLTEEITLNVGLEAKAEKYPNGWYRISVKAQASSTGTSILSFRTRNDDNDVSFAGDVTKGLILWGAQVEVGYLTSYIPTFDATSSRNAEKANNATADFNDAEGVLYIEASELNNDGVSHCISINNNNITNRIIFVWQNTSNYINARVNSNTTAVYNHNQSVTDTTEFHKLAIRYKQDDFAFFVDGIKVDFQLSGDTPIGLSDFSFDNGTNSSGFFYGRVKQVLYFNEALTDLELETLTT